MRFCEYSQETIAFKAISDVDWLYSNANRDNNNLLNDVANLRYNALATSASMAKTAFYKTRRCIASTCNI